MNTETTMLAWLAFPLMVMASPIGILWLLRWRVARFRETKLSVWFVVIWMVVTLPPAMFYSSVALGFVTDVYAARDFATEDLEVMMGSTGSNGEYSTAGTGDVPYADIIIREAIENGIPVPIFFGLIEYESGFNPEAVSYAGAKGLGQLMPLWVNECGIDPFDPVQNLDCSGRVLGETYARYPNDERKAIAAYHAGWPGIDRIGLRPIDETYYHEVKVRSAKYAAPTSSIPSISIPSISTPSLGSAGSLRLSGDKCADVAPIYDDGASLTQGLHGYGYGDAALDYAGGVGAVVKSPINGIVTKLYTDGYGNPTLFIENDCYSSKFLHGNWDVEVGQILKIGDNVGTEGNNGYTFTYGDVYCGTGSNCGYHTHWNLFNKKTGQNTDPRLLFGY